jgi:hypothetical protein
VGATETVGGSEPGYRTALDQRAIPTGVRDASCRVLRHARFRGSMCNDLYAELAQLLFRHGEPGRVLQSDCVARDKPALSNRAGRKPLRQPVRAHPTQSARSPAPRVGAQGTQIAGIWKRAAAFRKCAGAATRAIRHARVGRGVARYALFAMGAPAKAVCAGLLFRDRRHLAVWIEGLPGVGRLAIYPPDSRRYRLGVMPHDSRMTVVRWPWLAKPHSSAICATRFEVPRSSFLARSSRRSIR